MKQISQTILLMNLKFASIIIITSILFLIACDNQTNDNQNSLQTESKPDTTMSTNISITDPHSFARPEEAKMTHLNLDIEVDFDQKIIKGKASIQIDKQTEIVELFLDTKDLDIQKVTLEEEEKETDFYLAKPFEHLGSELKIKLGEETKLVHIYYETSPNAEALQWLDSQQTSGKKLPFLFTQSQAILARSWVPCQDSPGIRFTYDAKIKVPKEMLALMSAENPQEKNETGIYQFKMPQPIPAYLLALSVGDLVFKDLGNQTGVYAEPDLLEASVNEFVDLPKMLKAAEDLYGEYRWGRYDLIVLPPSFPFGGMENPRLTFATPTILAGDRSLVSLVAHELAHSWSGNLVTNATWNDFWLNEGFTVYFELRIMEALYGKDYAEMLAFLGFQDLQHDLENLPKDDTHLKLDLKGRNPDDGVTSIAYEKGCAFLKAIDNAVGREKWDAFVKKYFNEFAFKTMNTEAFLDYLSKELPEIEGKINIKDWVYAPGLPENFEAPASSKFEQVEAALKQWQDGVKLNSIPTSNWSSHEWLFFIRQLPQDLDTVNMAELDDVFQFTASGNSEILAAWLELSIKKQYTTAYPALEAFLIRVGRRKFLVPLYDAMTKNEEQMEMAKNIYQKARSNYHFVSTNTIDQMLEYNSTQ